MDPLFLIIVVQVVGAFVVVRSLRSPLVGSAVSLSRRARRLLLAGSGFVFTAVAIAGTAAPAHADPGDHHGNADGDQPAARTGGVPERMTGLPRDRLTDPEYCPYSPFCGPRLGELEQAHRDDGHDRDEGGGSGPHGANDKDGGWPVPMGDGPDPDSSDDGVDIDSDIPIVWVPREPAVPLSESGSVHDEQSTDHGSEEPATTTG